MPSTNHLEGLDQLINVGELSEYFGAPVKTIYDRRLTGPNARARQDGPRLVGDHG